MGWMHDVIDYFSNSPSNRSCNHGNLTFGALYQFSENFMQAFSHDEVVHGKGALVNKMGLNLELDKIANLKALASMALARRKTFSWVVSLHNGRSGILSHPLIGNCLNSLSITG